MGNQHLVLVHLHLAQFCADVLREVVANGDHALLLHLIQYFTPFAFAHLSLLLLFEFGRDAEGLALAVESVHYLLLGIVERLHGEVVPRADLGETVLLDLENLATLVPILLDLVQRSIVGRSVGSWSVARLVGRLCRSKKKSHLSALEAF